MDEGEKRKRTENIILAFCIVATIIAVWIFL